MKGIGRPRKRMIGASCAALVIAAALAASAIGETVHLGELEVSIEGSVTPKKLPKKTPAPVSLKVSGSIKESSGAHPPALKTLALEFTKYGHINTKGLSTCTPGKLQSTSTAQARKACGDALIGTGTVSANIALPEQAPFNASGPLLIFNGPSKGGNPVLIFHVHANVPAPTTFVTTAVVSKGHGKYGTSTLIQIPTIVGGSGSLTSFTATIHKTYTYKNQKVSVLTASCPTGSLVAHGEFTFVDHTVLAGNVARPCTPGK